MGSHRATSDLRDGPTPPPVLPAADTRMGSMGRRAPCIQPGTHSTAPGVDPKQLRLQHDVGSAPSCGPSGSAVAGRATHPAHASGAAWRTPRKLSYTTAIKGDMCVFASSSAGTSSGPNTFALGSAGIFAPCSTSTGSATSPPAAPRGEEQVSTNFHYSNDTGRTLAIGKTSVQDLAQFDTQQSTQSWSGWSCRHDPDDRHGVVPKI